jgi:large subunit ribosomal protein L25
MQRHPVAQTVTHVDFIIVRRDEVISADVPITLVGEAMEVQHGDGLVEQQMFTLPINARPADIPTSLEADISALTIGGQMRVSDLTLPSGVTTEVDPETAIAIGQPPRVVVEEEAAAEGEVGEEGAAEEGAAPSGEAQASDSAAEEG